MKKLFSILLILSLTACGWHLRGSMQISSDISPVYLSAVDSQGALMTELRKQLKSAHIATVEDSDKAQFSIIIKDENKDKRTAGVGSDALSSAYEITYKITFEIHSKKLKQFDKAVAVATKSYNYSTQSIGSAAQEEILLEQEIRRDLAQQILRRLNAFATHPNSPNVSPEPETKSETSTETQP